ncbi:MAG TPA: DUF4410 domain-containing protein [Burkholderiaceae bacterium]|nr:DUF4410 domain-containing protein [Burkholderiaceae bacterium]HMM53055.1 DUF4410 domain-containing protein [Burkholderiaceae bacterium]
MKRFAGLVLVAATASLGLSDVAPAKEPQPVVWIDKQAQASGRKILRVAEVSDKTGQSLPPERLAEVRERLENALRTAGLLLGSEQPPGYPEPLLLETSVTSYKTGDPAGRWIGFGAGAAKCTMRARLVEATSGRPVAEVIHTRIVDSGGLLTIGADARIHLELADDLAKAIVAILDPGRTKP